MIGDYSESSSNNDDDNQQYHYNTGQLSTTVNNEKPHEAKYQPHQHHYYNERQRQLQHSRSVILDLASQSPMYVILNILFFITTQKFILEFIIPFPPFSIVKLLLIILLRHLVMKI
jgi:hypothetical protein